MAATEFNSVPEKAKKFLSDQKISIMCLEYVQKWKILSHLAIIYLLNNRKMFQINWIVT